MDALTHHYINSNFTNNVEKLNIFYSFSTYIIIITENRAYHFDIYNISYAISSICGDEFIERSQDWFIQYIE